jgi:hypothetical protein
MRAVHIFGPKCPKSGLLKELRTKIFLFFSEILRKTFEKQRNNFTTDMEEGMNMLKELSGKIKEYQHMNQVFCYSLLNS